MENSNKETVTTLLELCIEKMGSVNAVYEKLRGMDSNQQSQNQLAEAPSYTKSVPNFSVTIEEVGRYLQVDNGEVVRVVFRRSDDGRRTTCFFPANKFAAESLHVMLNKFLDF